MFQDAVRARLAKVNVKSSKVRGVPLLGILPEIRKNPTNFLHRVMREYGSMAEFYFGPQRVIMAGHPDAVKYITVTNASNYEKIKYVDKLKPLLGDSVLTSHGPDWAVSRKIIQQKMTAGAVQKAVHVIDEIIRKNFENWNGTLDVSESSTRITLKVICATMLGNADEDEVTEVISAMHIFQNYFSTICWSIVDTHRLFKTKVYLDFLEAKKNLFSLVGQMIARRHENGQSDDLLQGLIEATNPSTGQPLSEQRIQEEIIAALIAGHETTGQTLSFAWHKLAEDKRLQEKLREEAFRFLPLDRPPSFHEIKNMKMTAAFMMEIERLYPSVWWVARTVMNNDQIMGIKVRKGDVIMLTPYVTHRLPEFWSEPNEFKADRFITEPPAHKFSFVPFGSGPRICPGVHLASIEMILAIGRLLQSSEISGQQSLEVEGMITLRPKGGMPLELKKYTRLISVENVIPGEHALVDTLLRMRKKVFVDGLNWNLNIDEEEREIDQFDNRGAQHCALISGGKIKAFGRLLPTESKCLLFDIYGWLIDDNSLIERGPTIWEGTRMAVAPDVSYNESAYWLRLMITLVADMKAAQGVTDFCSVSDPTLERVLRRTGIPLTRLGSVKTDKNGQQVMGLRLSTDMSSSKAENLIGLEKIRDVVKTKNVA